MNARFVLDESSWALSAAHQERLDRAVDALVQRIEVATERGEGVTRHEAFYSTRVTDDCELYSALFEPDAQIVLDRDLAERLRIALDHMSVFDETLLTGLDVQLLGSTTMSPGMSLAHRCRCQKRAMAVLPLPLVEEHRGPLELCVEGEVQQVHFVTTEAEHTAFFRELIEIEDVDHDTFPQVAPSAFPALEWLDPVWTGLSAHSACFFGDRRDTLVAHLSVLNDEGAQLFHACPGGNGVSERLSARHVDASSENGKARSHRPSIQDRTRTYRGKTLVFWWHTKIRWNEGRIHFAHIPHRPGSERPPFGHIVIAIFKDHCVLPN